MKKNIVLILVNITLCLVYFLMPKYELQEEKIENEEKKIEIKVLKENNKIENISLEDYIIGVVAAEMPALFHEEALRAQAIASRTYALYKIENSDVNYDVTTDVTTQSYITIEEMKTKWEGDFDLYYDKIKTIVKETENLVMYYNDEVICSFYFSISNGRTEDAANVFGTSLDYIVPVESPLDKNVAYYETNTTFTKENFCSLLNISCDFITIQNIIHNESGYIDTIIINNKEFKGTELRNLLGIRSADINIEISDEIIVTTKGYGHGVGMSQHGANEMAKLGSNYEEILNHYYKNIEILKYNV